MVGRRTGLGSADNSWMRALLALVSTTQPLLALVSTTSVLPRHCSGSPGLCLGPDAADVPLTFWHVLTCLVSPLLLALSQVILP